MDRRTAMKMLAAGMAGPLLRGRAVAQETPPRPSTGCGVVIYSCQLRRTLRRQQSGQDLFEPFSFLDHCHALGAGGMQVPLGVLDAGRAGELRRRAEEKGLFVEAVVGLPQPGDDVGRFEAEMQTAAACGAVAARTVMLPGRRYEFFHSLAQFREYDARGRACLERAAAIAQKHRVPLAVENHKDHRNDERVELLRHLSSEYVGACVDLGNSFSLLEDPIETVRCLAPWANAVHLKDQAVQLSADGFLLADVVLGRGFLDLKRMIELLRTARKNIRFSLELITRDPLSVPCLAEGYWVTFPDVPGRDLARTLRTVRKHSAGQLPRIADLPLDRQVEIEDANVRLSLDYARRQLAI